MWKLQCKCDTFRIYFHVKCLGTSKNIFLALEYCNELWCPTKYMPFPLDNNKLYLKVKATPIHTPGSLRCMPSFTIQFLLDEMPG